MDMWAGTYEDLELLVSLVEQRVFKAYERELDTATAQGADDNWQLDHLQRDLAVSVVVVTRHGNTRTIEPSRIVRGIGSSDLDRINIRCGGLGRSSIFINLFFGAGVLHRAVYGEVTSTNEEWANITARELTESLRRHVPWWRVFKGPFPGFALSVLGAGCIIPLYLSSPREPAWVVANLLLTGSALLLNLVYFNSRIVPKLDLVGVGETPIGRRRIVAALGIIVGLCTVVPVAVGLVTNLQLG